VSNTGELGEAAVLFGDPVLRSLTQGLGGQLAAPVTGSARVPVQRRSPASASGSTAITTCRWTRRTLDARLLGNLDAVRNVLESARGRLARPRRLARTNALADSSFTVNVVDADADGVPESATADGVALDVQAGA
jgi:hypothetical protein